MTEQLKIKVSVDYLFPIPFMRLNIKEQITPEILDELDILETDAINEAELHRTPKANLMTKNANVLDGTRLGAIIQEHLNSYSINVLGEDPTIKITTSWLNYNLKNAAHHKHPHPNSKVSGCFYIKTNDDSGKFQLHRPRSIAELFYNKRNTYNEFTYDMVWYQPQPYDLYMFPSFIEHSVEENLSDEPRISLAFNSFYGTSFGNDAYNRIVIKE
jgi:uncharacterized protein (TIGR02466 family)